MEQQNKAIQGLGDALRNAAQACVDAHMIPARATKPMVDIVKTDKAEAGKLLRGSVLKFQKSTGAVSYRIVPATAEVVSADGKISVIDKIGNSAKDVHMATLESDGLTGILPGLLTIGGDAGAQAGSLKAGGGLTAAVYLPSATGQITKLGVKVAGRHCLAVSGKLLTTIGT